MTADEITLLMKEKRIIPVSRKHTHKHHSLTKGSIKCVSKKCILEGVNRASSKSFQEILRKERIDLISNPWSLVLPEDIGSCYEIIMELQIKKIDRKYVLIHREDRRKSGIVHTPYDLALHMCNLSLSGCGLSRSQFSGLLAVDIANGAGAFTLQMARIISRASKMKIEDVFSKCIVGFDIDSEVLNVASFCFHIESNFPVVYRQHNLYKIDTLNGEKSVKIIRNRIARFVDIRRIIAIGNPPYVEVSLKDGDFSSFETRKSRNLSAYFLEQAMKILPSGSTISQVVPLSLIHSNRMDSLRKYLLKGSKSIRIQSFDCVPGYMFDQGKIGSNSNKSITQRIAIIQLTTGKALRTFVSSRYMRWRGDERNELFSQIPSVRLPKDLYAGGLWPSIGTKVEKNILKELYSKKRELSTLITEEGMLNLFIPNSTRYFISAVHQDLDRGQQKIQFVNQNSFDLAQIIINSNFFYWYWRVTDGGFSVSLNTISGLKIPSSEKMEQYNEEISKLAKKLRSKRVLDRCRVVKANKGDKINYKFDKDQKLMSEIDELINCLYDFSERYQYDAHKSNSISGLKEMEN